MILKEKINISLLTLLPLIAEDTKYWYDYIGIYMDSGKRIGAFVNGYYSDINKPWLDQHIFLVFETSNPSKFDTYALKRMKNYINTYPYRISNIFYEVYVFKIEDKFKKDMKFIIDGNLSSITKKAKDKITNFWSLRAGTILFDALYATNREETYGKLEAEYIKEEDYVESIKDSLNQEDFFEQELN